MIEDTIKQIEAQLEASALPEEKRAELVQLLGRLRAEVASLPEAHTEQARSIAGFAQVSAHEAMRTEQNPQLLDLSLRGLRSSVDGFEQSHPRLVQIVNAISQTLSNLGI